MFNLADLTDGELENTSFSLFICNLLSSYAEGTLGLNGGLLDLDQNLRHDTLNVLEKKTVTRITTFRSVSSEREAMLHAVVVRRVRVIKCLYAVLWVRENLLPETRFLAKTRVCSARKHRLWLAHLIVRLATTLFVYLFQWLLSKITMSSGTT